MLTGGSAAIVVRVYGPELEQLRPTAAALGRALAGIGGVSDLQVEAQVLVPEVQVRLRPEAAARFGLTPGAVRRAATTLVKGTSVGEICDGQTIYGVAVWGKESLRSDVAATGDLRIDAANRARLVAALSELPYHVAAELDPADLLDKPITIVGDDPRVDILTVAWTITFETACPNRIERRIAGVRIPYLSRTDLIESKRTGRPSDLADIEALSGIEE